MAFTNNSKSSSTFLNFLKRGKEFTMAELADYTFDTVVFMDGTVLKDVTFADLTDIVWANSSKNSSTFANQSKN